MMTYVVIYLVIGFCFMLYEGGRSLDPIEYYPDHSLQYRIFLTLSPGSSGPFTCTFSSAVISSTWIRRELRKRLQVR